MFFIHKKLCSIYHFHYEIRQNLVKFLFIASSCYSLRDKSAINKKNFFWFRKHETAIDRSARASLSRAISQMKRAIKWRGKNCLNAGKTQRCSYETRLKNLYIYIYIPQ